MIFSCSQNQISALIVNFQRILLGVGVSEKISCPGWLGARAGQHMHEAELSLAEGDFFFSSFFVLVRSAGAKTFFRPKWEIPTKEEWRRAPASLGWDVSLRQRCSETDSD